MMPFKKVFSKLSTFNRARKYNYFIQKFSPQSNSEILDVGFCNCDYSAEANYLEKNHPYPESITALGLESSGTDVFEKLFPKVKVVTYDGIIFPFAADSFDYVWSNAVLEHVGGEASQIRFVSEMLRVGKKVYFTTPNRYFPFDLHSRLPLVHWLPKKYFDKCLIATGNRWASGDYMNLLTKDQVLDICKRAGAKKIRIKRNRLCGFTIDFSVSIEK
ncbi:MAG: methyltransferase domain-containing protein [Bacteroidales bacterium]|nr:methyltransferase domain-containing protein [Bacteroidales bacterium]